MAGHERREIKYYPSIGRRFSSFVIFPNHLFISSSLVVIIMDDSGTVVHQQRGTVAQGHSGTAAQVLKQLLLTWKPGAVTVPPNLNFTIQQLPRDDEASHLLQAQRAVDVVRRVQLRIVTFSVCRADALVIQQSTNGVELSATSFAFLAVVIGALLRRISGRQL